jgi:sodium-coupled neutral amino acid transporter 11
MAASTIEIPTLSNERNANGNDEDYHNAITGAGVFSPTSDPNDTAAADENIQQSSKLSKPHKQSGIGGASANLLNSIVGAGIIGIPYALKQSGLVAGLFLLFLVAFLTDKSLRTIVNLASFHPQLRNRNVQTFEDLASYPFGTFGSNFILCNMFIMAYGAMVAYLLIIKDTIPTILGVDERWARTLIMAATSLAIMVPLSMQRDMASLAITSVFSVMADVFLVIFIASNAPVGDTVADAGGFGEVLAQDAINPTLFIGLGILSTAMACQHSAFIVSGSLENKTSRRWAQVTGISITIAAILCAILGAFGYLGFLNDTEGDVLNNFDGDSLLANFARFLLAITMFCTYPMESFVARHVLVMMFHDGDLDGKDDPAHTGEVGSEAGGYLGLNRRQSWTIGIYLLTLFPALFVDDLGPVLSITGSLGGGCISYLAPGLVYLGVNGDAFLSYAYGLIRKNENPDVTDGDLPVAGDTEQKMGSTGELPVAGSRINANIQAEPEKPLWWYLFLFPVWVKIASSGSNNMRKKLSEQTESGEVSSPYSAHATPPASPTENSNTDSAYSYSSEDVMMPNRWDYCMSIFFILFGILAAIAGVTSNIYVQIKGDE